MDAQEYNEYLDEIDEYARSIGFTSHSITSESGPDYWFDYFNDGFTPEEALETDMADQWGK